MHSFKPTSSQLQRLEQFIGDAIDDCAEIKKVFISGGTNETGLEYGAYICFDGTNNKDNRGTVYFTCHFPNSNTVEDFEVINITGSNYRATLFRDK